MGYSHNLNLNWWVYRTLINQSEKTQEKMLGKLDEASAPSRF